MRVVVVIALLVGIGAPSASACPPHWDEEEPRDSRVGLQELGFDHSGGVMPATDGVAAGVGIRIGRRMTRSLVPRLEGDVWVGFAGEEDEAPQTHGLYARAGVATRWIVASKTGRTAAGALWLDAGLGLGRAVSAEGATTTVTDLMLGVGAQLELLDMDSSGASKWMGGYLALRALIPSDRDLSPGVLVSAGYVWGR